MCAFDLCDAMCVCMHVWVGEWVGWCVMCGVVGM